MSIGVVPPPAQVIPENQVTVRDPVASCFMFILKNGTFVVLASASVRLPAIVTWNLLFVDRSKVTVAPSVTVDGSIRASFIS